MEERMTELTHDEIISIAGTLADEQIAAIIATGATPAELMEAMTFVAAGDEPEPEHHPSGVVARLCEILTADIPAPEEER
jgi:hypothetical protein